MKNSPRFTRATIWGLVLRTHFSHDSIHLKAMCSNYFIIGQHLLLAFKWTSLSKNFDSVQTNIVRSWIFRTENSNISAKTNLSALPWAHLPTRNSVVKQEKFNQKFALLKISQIIVGTSTNFSLMTLMLKESFSSSALSINRWFT